jgi:TonB family protein
MSFATFATFVDAPASSPRSSRLLFASVIACSSLALALAVAFTLERMSILRMPGPKTRYEFAAVVIAEPPKVATPPDKPEDRAAAGSEDPLEPTLARHESSAAAILDAGDPADSDASPGASTTSSTGIPGGPSGVAPCPGGICAKGPIGIPGGTGSCIGPNCKKTIGKSPAPKPLPLSSLGCIACADPNTDDLRRTTAGQRKSAGTNVTRFCVDATGRVEASSVSTQTSHGDPAIDRLCRDAVKAWRFSPTKVAGEGRRACSQASFRIDFQ